MYGKNWKLVEDHVGSRTSTQARSHAQKFFSNIDKQKMSMEEFLQRLTMDVIEDYKRKAEEGIELEEEGICEMILEMKGMRGDECARKKKEVAKRQKKQRIMNIAVDEVIKEQENEFSEMG